MILQQFSEMKRGHYLQIGTEHVSSADEKRLVVMSNKISLSLFATSIIFFVAYTAVFPVGLITLLVPSLGVLASISFILNYYDKFNLSRLWLTLIIPIGFMVISVTSKKYSTISGESAFYDFRYIMLISGVIPMLLFRVKEKMLLLWGLLLNFSMLMFFDVIHNFFGVGYFQIKGSDETYYFTNIVAFVTYNLMVGSIYIVKKSNEEINEQNLQLIGQLNNTKENLEERNAEIESQSQEMLAQSEVLSENQTKLEDAYSVIAKQKELLTHENVNLSKELLEKNQELTETNSELIKHNIELRQFSFTVSHNLRGPIASLLGLINILDFTNMSTDQVQVLEYIKSTTLSLDGIIRDLNKIVDIRYDIFRVKQRVDLTQELKQIKKLFQKNQPAEDYTINADIGVADFFSVKPMVHSILYNLISNSIKYRDKERPIVIDVKAIENKKYYILTVTDNGLGIDMKRHKENLFKLYQRFHMHTEGKGIGLYLVKLQCESLGGYVDVKSEVNKFTTFAIHIRKPENISRQVLYKQKHAEIFYDASLNVIGVVWKGPISSEHYREVFSKCLDFLQFYNTPNWISDISNQGPIQLEDQQWCFTKIIPAAVNNGLKRIGVVQSSDSDETLYNYVQNIKLKLSELNIHQEYFSDLPSTTHWIQEESEKSAIIN